MPKKILVAASVKKKTADSASGPAAIKKTTTIAAKSTPVGASKAKTTEIAAPKKTVVVKGATLKGFVVKETKKPALEVTRTPAERAKDYGVVEQGNGAKLAPGIDQSNSGIASRFTRRVVRPRDLLALDFTFYNLKVVSGAAGKLKLLRRTAGDPAYIIIGFPPQHLLEEAFLEDENAATPEPANAAIPVQSRLAEPSRLVFRAPANFGGIEYTLDEVLNVVRSWELNVAPTATPPDPRLLMASNPLLSGAVLRTDAKIAQRAVTVPAKKVVVTGKKVSARIAAAQAVVAVNQAEAHNKWYADRSPQGRGAVARQEVEELVAVLDKLKMIPKLAPPSATQTAIEAPTRLIISPNSYGAWAHATAPVEAILSKRVELWHTRLAVRAAGGVTERDDFRRTIRAIWSPDVYAEDAYKEMVHSTEPPLTPLDSYDRHQIVHLSANHQLYKSNPKKQVVPLPIEVDRLMLSSLGAWMNVRGAWDPPPGMSLESWINRSTLGRDHYVRVVYAGRLYPFGHRASLIKVTERKFHPGLKGNAALLRQRLFIVVREPLVLTGNTGDVLADEKLDLKMPLKSARITTLVTPNLDSAGLGYCSVVAPNSAGKNPKTQSLFWPCVGGKPFRFHVQCEDEAGALLDLSMPLFFVGNELLDENTGYLETVLAATLVVRYGLFAGFENYRRIDFGGQRVQFAQSRKQGDTSFAVSAMEFLLAYSNQQLVPVIQAAAITIPALKNLARTPGVTEVAYAKPYLQHGFDDNSNLGEVIFKLVEQNTTRMDFSRQGDRAGGLLSPNMAINGLSRKLGPFGGEINDLAAGIFKPQLFASLGDLLPKLFGCIPITELIRSDVGVGDLTKVPRFLTENLTAAGALHDDVNRIVSYLGSLNALGSQGGALLTAAEAVSGSVTALLGDPASAGKRSAFTTAFGQLVAAARTLRPLLGALAVPADEQFAKTQLEQVLAKFTVGLEAPASVGQLANRIADSLDALNEQRIKFEWQPPVQNWPASGEPMFELRQGGRMLIAVEMAMQSGTSKEPSLDVACRLENFDLNLIPDQTFIKLRFVKLEFTTSSRSKPDVNVEFDEIQFVGVLSFIETLRKLIPLDGFSDPPALAISEEGIEASFSIALPNLAVGVFSLANLSLGASLAVPFVGNQPLTVSFNFCERSNPFRLTVWCFGGGGFFKVTITPAGCQMFEASFEFGASVALDFGVASGSVSVMAGIYFKIETNEATLTGYFNVKGCVDVMGLISASLELNLELTYQFSSGKCIGRASMIVEIDVLLFSGSVEIECEKRFAGSNGDPTFRQIMAPYTDSITRKQVEPWAVYCEAFA